MYGSWADELQCAQGMRVLGLATRNFERQPENLRLEGEAVMTFNGFLAFLDPPKDCAVPCIRELLSCGIAIKVHPEIPEAHPVQGCHPSHYCWQSWAHVCMLHSNTNLSLRCNLSQMLFLRPVWLQVLTGDSLNTARRICKDMGIGDTHCVLGALSCHLLRLLLINDDKGCH